MVLEDTTPPDNPKSLTAHVLASRVHDSDATGEPALGNSHS
jgi:hypothetical protein